MALGKEQLPCIAFPSYRDSIIITDSTHGLAWEELYFSEDITESHRITEW